LLFGNPERVQARLSPDGARMSYLAPRGGVLNIWIATIGQGDDRPLTDDKKRGIHMHTWACDNRHVLYRQDRDGDENWHIYCIDLDDGRVRDLTPYDNVQAEIVALEPQFPAEILIQLNKRDARLKDVYRVNLATGQTDLVVENPGTIVGWVPDSAFRVRGAYAAMPDGGFDLLVRDNEEDEFETLIHWGPEDEGRPFGFTPDGFGMYIADSRGRDTICVKTIDLKSGDEKVLASDSRADLDDVVIHPSQNHIEAVSFNYERRRWTPLHPNVEDDFAAIERNVPGQFSLVSRDLADRNWLVAVTADRKPDCYYAYSRDKRNATFLFSTKPQLDQVSTATMQFVEIQSRDGLTLPSYLTLPVGVPPQNLPLVLNVHGGPWYRDSWEFRSEVQWLANRGYAVLQVNFRGSAGFGKGFLNAGNREWGRNMQNDLTDAVQWAIDQGYADPKRIAIYGGSYGGYAALAGAAFTPDLYRCAVSIVGPSNILTWMAAIPPYWEPMLKMIHKRVGDPETDAEMLRERSPLFSVDRIRIPMLIGQGANDPRVTQAESEQIVAALKAGGQQVEYALYPDEGHGLARPENRLDFYTRTEKFLAHHLSGRMEEEPASKS
jgi:dipeptidyl aminopeptidase/acylaminoacyl peptidase